MSRLRFVPLILLNSVTSRKALAADAGSEFFDGLSEVFKALGLVWNYPLRVVDNNPITVGSLIIGFILIVAGFHASRRASRQLGKKVFPKFAADKAAVSTFETLSFYVLVVFLTIFALKIANVPLTAFTVVGGAAAIGLGFGSQNVLNNFISGIILMLERPIKMGDFIEVDEAIGTVEAIGIRSTQVLLNDNRHVIVPNASFLEKNVCNWTHSNSVVRFNVDVGVAYGSPTDKVTELLHQAADEESTILRDPAPVVLFTDFGDNALAFRVMFWIRVHRVIDRVTIQSNIRYKVDKLFKEAGITIAFPQRDIHLDTLKPLEVRVLSS